MSSRGALAGLRVIEMGGIGPCPLAGQLLADHGAEVIVIDRASAKADPGNVNHRGKRLPVILFTSIMTPAPPTPARIVASSSKNIVFLPKTAHWRPVLTQSAASLSHRGLHGFNNHKCIPQMTAL